jgi:glycosyltransferase involved in cell wall biosynthesis
MLPKVSVILPAFQAAATLPRAIESILGQDFPHFELIVVDDGSTDDTAACAARYARQDARLRLLRRPHQGLVASLNEGISLARAPLIARMDADDYAFPSRLGKQVALLKTQPDLGLVSCQVAHGSEGEEQQGYAKHVAWLNSLVEPEEISLSRFIDAPVAHPSVMFRTEWVNKAGGYRETEGPEDFELWLRWLEAGIRMAKIPEVLLRWHDTPGRLSRTHPAYRPEAFARVRAPYLLHWLQRNNPHPHLAVWGSGRKTRKQARFLFQQGLHPQAFIDLKAGANIGEIPVWDYRSLKDRKDIFILSLVNNRGARDEIRDYLQKLGRIEGKDFLIA